MNTKQNKALVTTRTSPRRDSFTFSEEICPLQMSDQSELQLLVAAAEAVLPADPWDSDKRFATWSESVPDDDFDVESAAKYLESEGKPVERALLDAYSDPKSNPIALRRIGKVGPWIKPLSKMPGDCGGFEDLRKTGDYAGIITFTTPAISEDGFSAFLEVWTESGSHLNMGMWYWVLLRRSENEWIPSWKCMHAMS